MYDMMKNELNKTITENGDITYKSTLNANLDFYGIGAALRHNSSSIIPLFDKAYKENRNIALKNLFYLRDPRNGLGERELFRKALQHLIRSDKAVAKKLIPYIATYGRYDDLLVYLNTMLNDDVIEYIDSVIKDDLANLAEYKGVSLMGKWLPSINTSNKTKQMQGRHIARCLNMSERNYRKMLSKLRKGRIIEENLCAKDYTFNYESIPSKAFRKYRAAFERNDVERYNEFLKDVKVGNKELHTSVLYPHEIIKEVLLSSDLNIEFAEEKWKKIVGKEYDSKTIVVRDGSGSMTWNNYLPISIATALAMLFAEKLNGSFHNRFITFSDNPELVELKGSTLKEKVTEIFKYDDYTSTDISKVYNLILKVASSKDFKKEDMIERIVIISDMEFNQGVKCESTYETFKRRFEALGFKMPKVVYWNVCARNVHFATKADPNIRFVAGASKNVIDRVINDASINPVDFMMNTINRYSFIDEILCN